MASGASARHENFVAQRTARRRHQRDNLFDDGGFDGGADILLSDPNSEGSDLVIGQSKFYKNITQEEVLNAVLKMVRFYNDMRDGNYEQFNARLQNRFITLYSEVGEESKIRFIFYTSAPQKKINKERIEAVFRKQFTDSDAVELSILFGSDVADEIEEFESRKAIIEHGKIRIDEAGNFLLYGDDAAIVNVSAFSIKQLYAEHNIALLSRNLRYHIKGGNIDREISKTINETPELFWLKNNGITIICDSFDIDGNVVKLRNFSIVNGGQTTYQLHRNRNINETNDLYLPCKIIKTVGESEEDKNAFSLSIAKAANDQKPIKPADLKANAPEQIRFARAMRDVGIFYQTKRGEIIPAKFQAAHLHTKLLDVGKLCLAAVFQEPCKSRSKPSATYAEKYYTPIFKENSTQVAAICQELLYMDNYFKETFQRKFDRDNEDDPNANTRISFAHNARTICIAFAALAARHHQNNINNSDLKTIFAAGQSQSDSTAEALYKACRDLGSIQSLFPANLKANKDLYDATLDKLFEAIIDAGVITFSIERRHDPAVAPSNFLKNDKNYYSILADNWSTLKQAIDKIFAEVN